MAVESTSGQRRREYSGQRGSSILGLRLELKNQLTEWLLISGINSDAYRGWTGSMGE